MNAENLTALIQPTVHALGFELWGIEPAKAGNRHLLRIYIDSKNGVNVDDCALVSREVGAILDVEDPISGDYILEVSSPGLNRPFFNLSQYEAYIGGLLAVKLKYAFEGRKKYKGVLVAVESDDIVIRVDDEEYIFPFDSVDKANLMYKD